MGDYFHGWRRKLGVLTLVMACVLMVVWVRSGSMIDLVMISFGNWRSVFVSGDHKFQLVFKREEPICIMSYDDVEHTLACLEIGQEWFDGNTLDYDSLIGRLGWVAYGNQCEHQIMLIPYWLIVIPLALLSAYLLLSKPRTPHQTKITDPIHVDGA